MNCLEGIKACESAHRHVHKKLDKKACDSMLQTCRAEFVIK